MNIIIFRETKLYDYYNYLDILKINYFISKIKE